MGYLAKVIDSAFSTVLKTTVEARVQKVTAKFIANPAIGPAIDREMARQALRYETAELGLPVKTRYRDVYEFVDEVFLELYPAQLSNDVRWCARWWAHPAAVRRLTMAWASWETHRAENPATGEEVWARYVGDYHFRWLTGPNSPFVNCKEDKHRASPALPSAPMVLNDPAELSADAAETPVLDEQGVN